MRRPGMCSLGAVFSLVPALQLCQELLEMVSVVRLPISLVAKLNLIIPAKVITCMDRTGHKLVLGIYHILDHIHL